MGKKRVAVLGSEEESQLRQKHAEKLKQKKLREKTARVPGLKGGQRVVDTAAESLVEYEVIQEKQKQAQEATQPPLPPKSQRRRSKAYQNAKKHIDPQTYYHIGDAIKLLRQVSLTRFDPTVELHLTLRQRVVVSAPLKMEKDAPLIHTVVGKLSASDQQLIANIQAILNSLSLSQIAKVVLKSTMSPAIKLLL